MLMIMKYATRLGQACTLLTLAVLAGVAELIIALLSFSTAGDPPSDLVPQVGVHVAVYAIAFVLIGLTWRGNRVARWIVLIMLGLVGTASLVVPLLTELAAGADLAEALGGATSPYFPAVRAAHLVFVVAGSALLLAAKPVPGRAQLVRARGGAG